MASRAGAEYAADELDRLYLFKGMDVFCAISSVDLESDPVCVCARWSWTFLCAKTASSFVSEEVRLSNDRTFLKKEPVGLLCSCPTLAVLYLVGDGEDGDDAAFLEGTSMIESNTASTSFPYLFA